MDAGATNTARNAASPKAGTASEIHDLAKGWKAAIVRAKDPATRHESRIKNDRGNLPLHSAASFRAPIEVTGTSVVIVLYGLFVFILLQSFSPTVFLTHQLDKN